MNIITSVCELIPGIDMSRLQEYRAGLDSNSIKDYRQFNDFYYSGRHLVGGLSDELSAHPNITKRLEGLVLLDFGASVGTAYGWMVKQFNMNGYVGIEPHFFQNLFISLNQLVPEVAVPASIIVNDALTVIEALPNDLKAVFLLSGVGSEIVGSDYQKEVTKALGLKAGKGSTIINNAGDIYGYRVQGFKFDEVAFQLYIGIKD